MAEKTKTSTQIRNLFSEGMSSLNMTFFNTYLSFNFTPFAGKDQNGSNRFDNQKALTTTVNWEGAFALWKACYEIIFNSADTLNVTIPCNQASLILEKKAPGEVFVTISKNNETIPFKFSSLSSTKTKDGQQIVEIIETGLGAFMKTINGYLEGVNSARHLDKLTEEFAKLKENAGQQQPWKNKNFNNNRNNNWRNNNQQGWKNNNNQQQNWETPNQQNMSDYTPPQ